jgi:hypothetical protein
MNELADEIEMILDGTGLAWTRREDSWAVPADGVARELRISRTEVGVSVDAVLIEWDEAAPEGLEALSRFLDATRPDLRGAYCGLEETRAMISAAVDRATLETGIPEAIQAASFGCRFLTRAAIALLTPELARKYLMFVGPAVPDSSASGTAGPT